MAGAAVDPREVAGIGRFAYHPVMDGIQPHRPPAFRIRVLFMVGLALVTAIALFARPAIRQDSDYHRFADRRTLLGIPHCLNVLSNAPFVLIGAAGLCFVTLGDPKGRHFQTAGEHWPYLLLFLGVLLTGFGSAYYHLEPNNRRLVWDRLPMAVAFMALFAGILAERIDLRIGLALLVPLVAAGIGSGLYWAETDDLRPYYLVQFYPLLAIPLLLLLFPPRYTGTGYLFLALFWYVLAKLAEHLLDHPFFFWTGWVSGHTIKHLLAAVGAYCILRMVMRREPVAAASSLGKG